MPISKKVQALIDQIKAKKIQELKIPQKYNEKEFLVLMETIADSQSVKQLTITGRTITTIEAAALANLLEKNTSLKCLMLECNEIADKEFITIAKGLERNTSLIQFTAYESCIGDEGARAIAIALEKNISITSLCLSNNKIGINGIKAIAKLLRHDRSLTTLDLSENNFGYEGTKALDDALAKNVNIIRAEYDNNSSHIKYLCHTNETNALDKFIPELRVAHSCPYGYYGYQLNDYIPRLPSLITVLRYHRYYQYHPQKIHDLLLPLVTEAVSLGYIPITPSITFNIDTSINFSAMQDKDQLLNSEDPAAYSPFYRAAHYGEFDKLIAWHKDHRAPLLAEDLLRKEHGRNALDVIATRYPDQLPLLFKAEHWQGRPKELNQLAQYLTAKRPDIFEQQIGSDAYTELRNEVNLSCLKTDTSLVQRFMLPEMTKKVSKGSGSALEAKEPASASWKERMIPPEPALISTTATISAR